MKNREVNNPSHLFKKELGERHMAAKNEQVLESTKIRDRIVLQLHDLHRKSVESGDQNHVTTFKELAFALNVPERELKNLFRRAFISNSLNDVLKSQGLPSRDFSGF